MPKTAAPGGLSLTTALQEVIKNPAASKENRTYELRFPNITANASSADVTQCVLIDVGANNAPRPIQANNTSVGARETISVSVILEPGDSIQAAASAANAIYCFVQQIWAETVP